MTEAAAEGSAAGASSPRSANAVVTPPKRRLSARPFLVLGVPALIAAGVWIGYGALHAGQEATDDAQIESDVVPIAARVGGVALVLRAHDDQRVRAGDVIMELDPAELTARQAQAQAAVETARAQAAEADANVELVSASAQGGLHTAQASVTGARDAVRSASAQVQVAQAALTRAEAQAQLARAELMRMRGLFQDHAISQSQIDIVQSNADAADAMVAQAEASLVNAHAGRMSASTQIVQAQGRLEQSAPVDVQLAAARARADLQHARVREAEAALRLADLNLSYTVVRAPVDGTISRLGVRAGQIVTPGAPIANLVPTNVYVVANFKETQVGEMHARQRADIHVDALPGRTLHGEVQSVAGGTGARFSLLPPDNASGNFVKVVQRVPVRISFTDLPSGITLQAGLSADVVVHLQ